MTTFSLSCNQNHTSHNAVRTTWVALNEDSLQGLRSNVYVFYDGDKVLHLPPGDYVKPVTVLRKLIKWNRIRGAGQTG